MKNSNRKKILLICILCSIFACQKNEQDQSHAQLQENNQREVIVQVDGSPIYQTDIDIALGKIGGVRTSQKSSQALLESLITLQAVATHQSKNLTVEEDFQLSRELENYKKEWLLKDFVRKNVSIDAPTASDVDEYEKSQSSPKDYIYNFELVTVVSGNLNDKLKSLQDFRQKSDWAAEVKLLEAKNISVQYFSANSTDYSFYADLMPILLTLQSGEVSAVVNHSKGPYIVRVIDRTEKSLSPADNQKIRRLLANDKLKKAISKATKEIVEQATVEYHDDK